MAQPMRQVVLNGVEMMGRLAFVIAVGICALCLALAGALWAFAHRQSVDWTSPHLGRIEMSARLFLAIAVFAGICAAALYEWTYQG